MGVLLRQAQSQWTVLRDILLSQQMLTLSNASQMTIFLSRRQRTGVLCCVQHSPTAAALSTNTAFKWKMWFSCFPILPGSAEGHVIWGGILKRLLIAYFIGNISAKKYQTLFTCVKVIASHRWDVFWDTVYIASDLKLKWPLRLFMLFSP